MRILVPGNPFSKEKELWTTGCRECNCIFEFMRCEAKAQTSPRNEDFLVVTCPCCGAHVYHDKADKTVYTPVPPR